MIQVSRCLGLGVHEVWLKARPQAGNISPVQGIKGRTKRSSVCVMSCELRIIDGRLHLDRGREPDCQAKSRALGGQAGKAGRLTCFYVTPPRKPTLVGLAGLRSVLVLAGLELEPV